MALIGKKVKNMGWNYRILAHKHNEEVELSIHEVYYNDNDIPDSYTKFPVSVNSDSPKGIKWSLNKMQDALKKPILWAGKEFPKECKVKYECQMCGRNNFANPGPHKCKGGFRKRKLEFEMKYV